MSLDEHRMLPLSPPKGAQKRKTAVFRAKSHFVWKKSATKFVWKPSATKLSGIHWPTYLCRNDWWGISRVRENLAETHPPIVKRQFLPRCMECNAVLRWNFCLSVCPSVRPSVRQTRVLWQNGRKICPDFYTTRKIILSSFMRRMVGGGATPSIWNFGSTGPRWSEIADFEPIIVRSASAVRPAKKVQLTLIGSPLRAFQRV